MYNIIIAQFTRAPREVKNRLLAFFLKKTFKNEQRSISAADLSQISSSKNELPSFTSETFHDHQVQTLLSELNLSLL